jgi:hypothetical protein
MGVELDAEAHEAGLARFMTERRRRRFRALIADSRHRGKLTRRLAHRADMLDLRYAMQLPSGATRDDIERMLVGAGAPERCYVLADDVDLDRRFVALQEALDEIVSADVAALLSCVPGRLGLFSDEAPGGEWLLRRET